MGLILNGKYMNGLLYRGIEYAKAKPQIITALPYITKMKVVPSAGTEYTSGYLVTFGFTSSAFKLYRYDNINTPLTSLPTHKFLYNNVTQEEFSGLTLVYNGDETFSITGTISLPNTYHSSKNSSAAFITLVDENKNLFISDTEILTAATGTASTTTTFVSSTMTYENFSGMSTKKEDVSVPHTITSLPTGDTLYATGSGALTVSYSTAQRTIY